MLLYHFAADPALVAGASLLLAASVCISAIDNAALKSLKYRSVPLGVSLLVLPLAVQSLAPI
jgi:hypothetical protein